MMQNMQAQDLKSIFHLPQTQDAHQELLDMNIWLQDITYEETAVINGFVLGGIVSTPLNNFITLFSMAYRFL